MFASFTVSGTSLKLLKAGERGVISRLNNVNPMMIEKMRKLGLIPGTRLTVEQQFPRFLVRTHQGSFALSQPMIQAIYVRIAE